MRKRSGAIYAIDVESYVSVNYLFAPYFLDSRRNLKESKCTLF